MSGSARGACLKLRVIPSRRSSRFCLRGRERSYSTQRGRSFAGAPMSIAEESKPLALRLCSLWPSSPSEGLVASASFNEPAKVATSALAKCPLLLSVPAIPLPPRGDRSIRRRSFPKAAACSACGVRLGFNGVRRGATPLAVPARHLSSRELT